MRFSNPGIMKEKILATFHAIYGNVPALLVRSPGRVNIIGEHTDYNEGFVLPAAIDKAVYMAIHPRNDNEVHFYASAFGEHYQATLTSITKTDTGWPDYILGVVHELQQAGYPVQGFNAVIDSDLPVGAGLSSSAALECATLFALNTLFTFGISKASMIGMAQQAEHHFAGVMCGIMDMYASMMGRKDQCIKLDCRSLDAEYIPLSTGSYQFVLLNTNVKHRLAASAYNTRRQECAAGAAMIRRYHPEVNTLRDVTEAMLDKYVLPFAPVIDRRCRFVVQENARLQQACAQLKAGNLAALGQLMLAAHDGLSSQYEVSCRELDYLVAAVRGKAGVLGARMMGGGFGGCTLNLISKENIPLLTEQLSTAYQRDTGLPLAVYLVGIEEGTGVVM